MSHLSASGRQTSNPGKFRCEVKKDRTSSFDLPLGTFVCKTNQNRSCNGTFESCLLRQACTIRNEDTRYKINFYAEGKDTNLQI